MIKHYRSLSIEDRNLFIVWAASAATCWLTLSVGAALAGLAHLIHLA